MRVIVGAVSCYAVAIGAIVVVKCLFNKCNHIISFDFYDKRIDL